MNLGSTLDEKKRNYALLMEKAKRFATVFGGIGIVVALLFIASVLSMGEGYILILVSLLAPFTFYFFGFLWYFGYLTIKSWCVSGKIRSDQLANAVVDTSVIAYLVGGRKAVKTSLITMLIILMISVSIGFYIGIYQLVRIYMDAKRHGYA